MGAPTAFRARIESRRGHALGDVMSSMRVWLDRCGIDVVAFDFVRATRSLVAFDVYFRNEVDVALFQHEFGRRHVSRTSLLNREEQAA
jgi:uncharacterized protein (DUF934 family)